jgi:hypothetical protein
MRNQSKSTPKSEPRKNTSFDGVASRIQDISKIEKPMRVVFYGRAGTGKTTIAASFPAPLLIDFRSEQGTDSVNDVKGLKVIQAEEWDDLEQLYWYLADAKHSFKTVIIDTVTQMQELAIKHILSTNKKNTEDAGNWGSMSKQMWGETASLLKSWIMNYRNLDLNCVFIAQDRVFNAGDEADTEDGQLKPEVGPRLMPSVGSTLNAAVDLIGNTFIREESKRVRKDGKLIEQRKTQYCLRIGPHSVYTTKVRTTKDTKVPAFLVDATYEDLIELKNGNA